MIHSVSHFVDKSRRESEKNTHTHTKKKNRCKQTETECSHLKCWMLSARCVDWERATYRRLTRSWPPTVWTRAPTVCQQFAAERIYFSCACVCVCVCVQSQIWPLFTGWQVSWTLLGAHLSLINDCGRSIHHTCFWTEHTHTHTH